MRNGSSTFCVCSEQKRTEQPNKQALRFTPWGFCVHTDSKTHRHSGGVILRKGA
nr:MAG TPA: hypothetical protein [Caudoviricetes sp.]